MLLQQCFQGFEYLRFAQLINLKSAFCRYCASSGEFSSGLGAIAPSPHHREDSADGEKMFSSKNAAVSSLEARSMASDSDFWLFEVISPVTIITQAHQMMSFCIQAILLLLPPVFNA